MLSAETTDAPMAEARPRFSWNWVLIPTGMLLLLLAIWFLPLQDLLRQMLHWIDTLGAWAPAIFIAVYVVTTALLIPGSLLTVGAGALFGLLQGFIIASFAATLAAACSFLIGRHLARDMAARRIERNERFTAIDHAVAGEGWKIVLLMRLSPIFPYTLLNYLFGLTRVKLSHYVLASWVGMLPGTALYVYLGALAKVAAEDRVSGEWVLHGAGLVATIAVTIFITRIARKALTQKISA
jgi:uncharacterized membrane protein YdjX (TVP38/TMEM64 family)